MAENREPWIGMVIDEQTTISLGELCRACSVHAEYIIELVEEGVIEPEPSGPGPRYWRFTGDQIRHARIAMHLQRDLGVNAAGIAVALQLLDEIEMLRARLRALGD